VNIILKLHFGLFASFRVDGRYFFRVLPRLVMVPPPGMAPCAAGSIVEVLVSATGKNSYNLFLL
jgi:hypothetical protein